MGNKDKASEKLSCGLVGSLSTWAVGVHPCLKGLSLATQIPALNTFRASGGEATTDKYFAAATFSPEFRNM